jgi:hypothetical protein
VWRARLLGVLYCTADIFGFIQTTSTPGRFCWGQFPAKTLHTRRVNGEADRDLESGIIIGRSKRMGLADCSYVSYTEDINKHEGVKSKKL